MSTQGLTPGPTNTPTPEQCNDVTKKGQCNTTEGCAWVKKKDKCKDAKNSFQCKKYGKAKKCRDNGCVWEGKKGKMQRKMVRSNPDEKATTTTVIVSKRSGPSWR